MRDSVKAILNTNPGGGRIALVPCRIVSVSPLVVSLNGADVPASAVTGLDYTPDTTGVALWAPPAVPLVFPID